MSEKEKVKLSQLLLAELGRLNVPEGDVRRLVTMLGGMMDNPDRTASTLAAQKAWLALWPLLIELYEPKTPLQEQRDYERVRREFVALGYEVPKWDEMPEWERQGLGSEPSS